MSCEHCNDLYFLNFVILRYFKEYPKYCPMCGEKLQEQERLIWLDDLQISSRLYNCLFRNGIKTLNEISGYTIMDVMKFRNLGRKLLNELMTIMNEYGFEFKKEESENEEEN